MNLKPFDFKSIKISFEFQKKIIIINAEPFKTFGEIKEKIINKFIELPLNIHFYYMGRDLSNFENEKLGKIFNHKNQVKILLRLPTLKLKPKNIKNELLLGDKNISKINDSPQTKKSQYLLNTQIISLNDIKNKTNVKTIKSQDSNKNDIIDFSFINNKFPKRKSLIGSSSMPNFNIKKNNNNINIIKNKYNIETNLNNLDNLSLCESHKYKISEYCRTCKKFICKECRLNQEHKNHLTICLNFNNLEESIKLYIMLIQTNEKKNIEIINRNTKSDGDDLINIEGLSNREEFIIEKCDKLIKNYDFFIKKIQKKLSQDKNNYKTIIINTFNDIALKISRQINDILNKLDEFKEKKQNPLTIDELKYFFDEIARKEETLDFIREKTVKYLLLWEINRKIENSFDQIENTLDEILNEEKPFKELMQITNIKDNHENNNKQINQINKRILNTRGQRRNGLIYGNV